MLGREAPVQGELEEGEPAEEYEDEVLESEAAVEEDFGGPIYGYPDLPSASETAPDGAAVAAV